MRKYQTREATESEPALSPPKANRKRATPSGGSGKAAPVGTAVRERPCARRSPRVIARIPSLATLEPVLAAEGPAEAGAGWLRAALSRRVVLGGVVLLVSCAVVTAIWQFNGSTEKKDSSATATCEPGSSAEMHASSTSAAAPWAGAAVDAAAGREGPRRGPERAGQAPSGRYSPYEAAEAALPHGAAARWDNVNDALPTGMEYRESGDRPWPRPRMPLSYSESLEAEGPEPADAGYAPSAGGYPVNGAIADAERWLPPETGAVSRDPAGPDDRPTTSRQAGPEYRTASRPGGRGWQFGSSDESYPSTDYPPTGLPRASAGPRSGVRSGVNPATSARDAGAARFDGTIQKQPPTRTSSYERTGSSLY